MEESSYNSPMIIPYQTKSFLEVFQDLQAQDPPSTHLRNFSNTIPKNRSHATIRLMPLSPSQAFKPINPIKSLQKSSLNQSAKEIVYFYLTLYS